MSINRSSNLRLLVVLMVLFCVGLVAACQGSAEETPRPEKLQTQLLVKAPDRPLPVNRPVTVRSHTQDPQAVSHVELYAIELPSSDETDVLLRSDPASFAQTSFTVNQTFIPTQTGHYVIKVIGYNINGRRAESNFLGFDVE